MSLASMVSHRAMIPETLAMVQRSFARCRRISARGSRLIVKRRQNSARRQRTCVLAAAVARATSVRTRDDGACSNATSVAETWKPHDCEHCVRHPVVMFTRSRPLTGAARTTLDRQRRTIASSRSSPHDAHRSRDPVAAPGGTAER